VPSAMLSYWKSKNRTEKYGLLFPMIWFLSVLIFFSLSRGKRSDHILPSYPAASVIVGQFCFSLVERDKPDHWNGHLRTLSLGYFLVSFFVAAGLLMLWVEPEVGEANYLALRERANLEFLVLEKSECLISEKGKYVLLGRRPIRNFRSSRHGRNR